MINYLLHEDDRRKLYRVMTRLYAERRMTADEMRDMAAVLDGVMVGTEASEPITPNVVVYVDGGVIQDIAFDAPARVIVIDSDVDNDDEATEYTAPDGRSFPAWVSVWDAGNFADDAGHVRAALDAAGVK